MGSLSASHRPWFYAHAKSIIFIIVALAAFGVYTAFNIPIAVFPSTNFPRVVIGIDNGVMPIDQMLVTVTRPVENAVNSVRGLTMVRSITSRGSAEIDLYFNWNVDMFQTLQRVNAALTQVRASLPPSAVIETHRLSFASFPILGYSLTSDTVPPTRLWELATYELKPRLNRLDGVSTVVVQGGQVPEFHIVPDPAKLVAAKITVQNLIDAIKNTNVIDSPGLTEANHQLILGLVTGQVTTPEEISGIVVKTTGRNVPVRIGDVATVERSVKPVYTIVTANGKPAVLLNINRQRNSNTVRVADEVHAEIDRLRRELPPDVHIQNFYDQSDLVRNSIASVRDAIVLGLVLAGGVIVLFLRDWGSSVVAALVIPVTLAASFVALYLLGQSFNLMTLGGLAAAVGLVIDTAIVVVENIVLHRESGENRHQAIQNALNEITVPLVGSTITPIVVFLPLISISGVTGTFFRALAITMGVALLASLVLALTWTPTLSQFLIRVRAKAGNLARKEGLDREFAVEEPSMSGLFGKVIRFYERWLVFFRQRPIFLVAGCVALAILTYFSYQALGSDLLPAMDEGGFVVDYFSPPGTSLSETNRMVSHAERILRSIPEVEGTSRRTGLQLGLAAVTEANRGDISVRLKSSRTRSSDEIIAEARRKIEQQEPVLHLEFVQTLQDMIGDLSDAPQPVQIKLFTPDANLLPKIGPQVADAIAQIPGLVDVKNGVEDTISGPAIQYRVNPTAAASAGFTPEEVTVDATTLMQGAPAPVPVVTADRAYTIRVRMPAQNRRSLQAIGSTVFTSAAGNTAALSSLATVSQIPGQMEIREENLQRNIAVTARLEGTDLGTAMAQVQQKIAALHLPSSVRVEYGGTYLEQQRSFHDLLRVLLIALVLVFGVLLFEFGSFSAAVAILASALLSTSGVVFALFVSRTQFNIASFMGLIMIIGIVAKNGILLIDADVRFRGMGLKPEEAMIQAGRRRLRPIAMTAIAAIAGMLPLALAIGAGSQMLQPLAIAVIGGLVISMILSLIVTPTVFFYLTRNSSPSVEMSSSAAR
jgi:CzcA family heavy metal efflux pump